MIDALYVDNDEENASILFLPVIHCENRLTFLFYQYYTSWVLKPFYFCRKSRSMTKSLDLPICSFSKLASDLKATKMEEMKVQLEVLYTEVLRLRNAPAAEIEYARHTAEMAQGQAPSAKESHDKIEALSKAIKKINEDKTKLATENKTLKEDLQRLMEQKDQAENIKRKFFS